MRPLILCLATLFAGCTLNDVYHAGKDTLDAARVTSSIGSDAAARFRVHPTSSIQVQTASSYPTPEWLTFAQSGVEQVFPSELESRAPNYRLVVSWPHENEVGMQSSASQTRLLDIKLGGLFEPPSIAEVETLTVRLLDSSNTLVHQQRLKIKPALWQGDWDTQASMERAFYQFALDLAGR